MREIEKEYEVHYYEIDRNGNLTANALLSYLEDLFVYHLYVNDLNFKYSAKNKLSWIIGQWDINMKEYPSFADKIYIKIYPVAYKKFYLWNKYEIYNKNRKIIGSVDSAWLLINTESRKLENISEVFKKAFELTKDDEKMGKIEKLQKIQSIDNEISVSAKYTDIDTNGHVNNITYLSWAIETIPMDIIEKYKISNLQIKYYKECMYGEKVNSRCEIMKQENSVQSRHEIVNKNGDIITFFNIIWVE